MRARKLAGKQALNLEEYHYSLDRGRLAIPPPFRPLFKEGISFYPGKGTADPNGSNDAIMV